MKKYIAYFMCALMIFSGCSSSKTATGTGIGAGAGAVLGAVIGVFITKDAKGAAIGAAAGAAVGGGTGAIIGSQMDKKAKELEALENAKIETITDANGLTAIKVTFDSGILFGFNSSELSDASKVQLKDFSDKIADLPDTDITVWGHTDNVGSESANEKVSKKRADAVGKYLQTCGIEKNRINAVGKSFTMPVADNETEEGRAANRRVEIYISADEDMIKAAQAAAAEAQK